MAIYLLYEKLYGQILHEQQLRFSSNNLNKWPERKHCSGIAICFCGNVMYTPEQVQERGRRNSSEIVYKLRKTSALFQQPLYHCNSAIKLCHKLLCKALRLYKKYIFSNNIRINLRKSLLAQISDDFLSVTDLVRSQNYSLYASKVNYC